MPTKQCKRCRQIKDINQFETFKTYKRNVCKKCRYVSKKAYMKTYLYNYKLINKYGIDGKKLNMIIKKQNNKCPICQEDLTDKYHIDHDHKTGKVRGVLCNYCNQGLGQFRDNKNSLKNAIKYLGDKPH